MLWDINASRSLDVSKLSSFPDKPVVTSKTDKNKTSLCSKIGFLQTRLIGINWRISYQLFVALPRNFQQTSVCSLQILAGHNSLLVFWDVPDIPGLINQLFGEQRGQGNRVLYRLVSYVFYTSQYHTFNQGILMTPFPQSATSVSPFPLVYSLCRQAPPPPLSNIHSFPSIFCLILLACCLCCSNLGAFAQQHGCGLPSSTGTDSVSPLCHADGFHTTYWSLFTV